MKLALFLLFILSVALAIACGTSPTASNSANANANANTGVNVVGGPNNSNGGPVEIKLDPANMPPGLSANPIIVNGNVNGNTKPKRGTTPTPGIPSEAEIRKMLSKPGTTPPPVAANTQPMMKSNRVRPAGTPQ